MATWIIGIIIFAIAAGLVYRLFFDKKKRAAGCDKCADSGCPLFDQVQQLKENNQKKA